METSDERRHQPPTYEAKVRSWIALSITFAFVLIPAIGAVLYAFGRVGLAELATFLQHSLCYIGIAMGAILGYYFR